MTNRWLIAVPVSFALHAVMGWYFIVGRTPIDIAEKPASNQAVALSLSAFKPAVTETPNPAPSPPAPEQPISATPPPPKVDVKDTPPPKVQKEVAVELTKGPVRAEKPITDKTDHETAATTPPKKQPAEPAPPPPVPVQEPLPERPSPEVADQAPTDTPIAEAAPSDQAEKSAVEQTNEPVNPDRFTEEGLLLVVDPVYLKRNKPVYPRRAIKTNQEGTVIIDATLNEEGWVIDTRIFTSSGSTLLDRSALDAVKEWQFKPASRNGSPVMSVVRIPVEFRLE
ncbi:MAG: energy transducer TonB [Hahellaceae bacterium]|nr:energy transducer TonB [Hahellaceae bacterium]